MKKILMFLAICVSMLGICGCGERVDIALITDMGTVEDGSFNQGAWEGIMEFAESNDNKVCKYYEPKDTTTDSYLASIKEAVKEKAEVVVCSGFLFEEAVYTAQKKYPYVQFILIDGVPHDSAYSDYTIKENTVPIMFSEEQLGFLAGYAAVRDGNTNIGFMGGMEQEAIVQFGYGFVQGADYAAIERGVDVNLKYCYTGTFSESDEVNRLASEWYKEGVSAIFACGGSMGRSVMSAAESSNGKVIGVDIDQSYLSETVITSAKKMLSNAVCTAVSDYYGGSVTGGAVYDMDAANDGIGLEMTNSRFETFSEVEYSAIYSMLVTGRIVPYSSTAFGDTSDIELVNTKVENVEL